MLSNKTLLFLKNLKKHNNKDWFEANRKDYEAAQAEIRSFTAAWIQRFGKTEPSITDLDPKKCIFRIHRDVRFSKNKAPYKNNLGAYLNKGGKSSNTAGYYLHIEPGNCFFGAGKYMPDALELAKIRQEVDYNFSAFQKILQHQKFKKTLGELDTEHKLKRAPKDYEEDNPAIEYLKLKGFTVFKEISDAALLDKDFLTTLVTLSNTAKPLVDFLNVATE